MFLGIHFGNKKKTHKLPNCLGKEEEGSTKCFTIQFFGGFSNRGLFPRFCINIYHIHIYTIYIFQRAKIFLDTQIECFCITFLFHV